MSFFLVKDSVVLENPAAVLFDKDGTLIDIHHYWTSMIQIRAKLIGKHWFFGNSKRSSVELALMNAMGVDLDTGRMKPEGPVGVKPREYIVHVAVEEVCRNGHIVNDESMELLFQEADRVTAEDLRPLLRLLPGADTLLKKLKHCRIPMAVVSTDITSRARKAFEILGLDQYFSEIIGGDKVKLTKPAPDLALHVIEKLGCAANDVVVIGDHPVDIKMGTAAGVGLNIGVLNGLSLASAFQGLPCTIVPDLTSIDILCTHA